MTELWARLSILDDAEQNNTLKHSKHYDILKLSVENSIKLNVHQLRNLGFSLYNIYNCLGEIIKTSNYSIRNLKKEKEKKNSGL